MKYVFVLDTDIDPGNTKGIFCALATRCQPNRDFLILPGALGTDMDISAPEEAVVTKVCMDCTAKPYRISPKRAGWTRNSWQPSIFGATFVECRPPPPG
jgi:3-polyprenyl-4-hydroxybenzoate decarboxylase